MAVFTPPFRRILPVLAGFLFWFAAPAMGQDSVAVAKITRWIQENDPQADMHTLKSNGSYFALIRVLSEKVNDVGEREVLIWSQYLFAITGVWIESRTWLNGEDCSPLGDSLCKSIGMMKKGYLAKYAVPVTGTFQFVKSSYDKGHFEIPRVGGNAWFDLNGKFIELGPSALPPKPVR